MGKKACCFYFGKRKFNFESLKPTLKSEIEKLVATFNVTEFYVCAQNEFDNLCIECVKEAKSVHSPLKICLVSLNFTQRVKVDKSFDEIIQLNQEGVSHQLQKLSLFEWLINKADFLISLTDSKETRITVRNLADKDLLFFSTRIRLLRLKHGLSQRNLAESIGVAPSTIAMYEQGRREPDFPTLLNMCMKLETTPDYVLGLDKKFKSRLVEIDALLSKFLDEIKKSNRLLCDGKIICREDREKLAVSLQVALEIAKKFIIEDGFKNKQ